MLPDPFIELSARLDDIQAALLGTDSQAISQACQTFTATLATLSAHPVVLKKLSAAQAAGLQERFRLLRQSVLQRSAANDRQLAILLPESAQFSYGGKSAFGASPRTPRSTSYQA